MNLNFTKILLLVLIFIVAFALLIHPTLYKYEVIQYGSDGQEQVIKINRVTGSVEYP
jgi:membrane protein YdbS with pleckstrin-like domain